jgi:hypothetical protein
VEKSHDKRFGASTVFVGGANAWVTRDYPLKFKFIEEQDANFKEQSKEAHDLGITSEWLLRKLVQPSPIVERFIAPTVSFFHEHYTVCLVLRTGDARDVKDGTFLSFGDEEAFVECFAAAKKQQVHPRPKQKGAEKMIAFVTSDRPALVAKLLKDKRLVGTTGTLTIALVPYLS